MTEISVVIISKNERGLSETIDALVPQCRALDSELIVVDASGGTLDDVASRYPDVRWIPFRNIGKKQVTIPEQRNVGVRAAAGDIIVFTDCGCLPAENWLAEITAPIRRGEELVVAGLVRSRRPSVYDNLENVVSPTPEHIDECPTNNLAFARTVFDHVDGFDESFEYGSDIDISWRWRNAGYRILRVPQAVVLSDWGTGRRQADRSFKYGAARARLYVKHRDRLRHLPRRDPSAIVYPSFLMGLPVMLLAPVAPAVLAYPLLLAVPLWRNRRARPVSTVYGHLMYGLGILRQLGRQAVR